MRRMLEELYFGNINPNVKRVIRDSRYDRAMRVVSENEEKLTLLLDGKAKSLFLDFVNAHSEVNGITGVESFIDGFRLGARITIEIMDQEDGCLVDID